MSNGSILDQLREERRRVAAEKTIEIPHPVFRRVVVRYRLLDPLGEGKEIQQRAAAQSGDETDAQDGMFMDILVAACDGLYLRTEAGLEPIDPDGNGAAQYDSRLADALGIEVETSREVLMALFDGNLGAMRAHAMAVMEWMTRPATFRLGEL